MRAPTNKVTVNLDGHELGLEFQVNQKLGDSQRRGHLAALAVQRDLQGRSQGERSTKYHS